MGVTAGIVQYRSKHITLGDVLSHFKATCYKYLHFMYKASSQQK